MPPTEMEVEARTAHETGDASIASRSEIRKSRPRRKGNPKILIMGTRRSGKSSIQRVIFEKLSPAETLYLNTTNKVEHATLESFITFESAEIPANLPFTAPDFDRDAIFASAGAVIWVLDIQDEYLHSIGQLIQTAVFLMEHYPRINLEVFIHKIDGLSEEYKYDTFRSVRQRVQDELTDHGYGYGAGGGAVGGANISSAAIHAAAGDTRGVAFYQTSIFNHSIYEAMSKVVQKLLPRLPAIEGLLNKLCSACRIQKAYLFDSLSKIYLATDASPTFLKDYEACSDYLDVIVDIKQIYSWDRGLAHPRRQSDLDDEDTDGRSATDSRIDDSAAPSMSDLDSDAVGESLITHDKSGNLYLYAREVNEHLALICIMGQGSTPEKRVLIDYNVSIVHKALMEIFQL